MMTAIGILKSTGAGKPFPGFLGRGHEKSGRSRLLQ
jgi:hypothetical protein